MKATILRIDVDGTEADVRAALDLLVSTMGSPNDAAIKTTHLPRHTRDEATTPTPSGPVSGRGCDSIISHAPESLGEMPAFFDRLTDQQLDSAWVACIIDCATREDGRLIVSQLAAVCNAVRSRYRAAAIDRPGNPPPPDDGEPGHRLWPVLLADMLEAIPEVGDEVIMRDFAKDKREQATLRNHMCTKRDDQRVEWVKGVRGSHGVPPKLRRVKL